MMADVATYYETTRSVPYCPSIVLVHYIAVAIDMKKHVPIFREPKLVKYKAAGRSSPPGSVSQTVL